MIDTNGGAAHARQVFPINPWTKFLFSKKRAQPKPGRLVFWDFGGVSRFSLGYYDPQTKMVVVGYNEAIHKRIERSPKGAIWMPIPCSPECYERETKIKE